MGTGLVFYARSQACILCKGGGWMAKVQHPQHKNSCRFVTMSFPSPTLTFYSTTLVMLYLFNVRSTFSSQILSCSALSSSSFIAGPTVKQAGILTGHENHFRLLEENWILITVFCVLIVQFCHIKIRYRLLF